MDLSPVDIHLKSGKDRPVRSGHPWIFSGAIRDLDTRITPGTIVRVRASDGELLGSGYLNPRCPIAVRMLTWGDAVVDAALISRRVAEAVALRRDLIDADTNVYRLINGEGDRLPGVLCDRYDDVVVLQCLTAGAEHLKALVLEALVHQLSPRAVAERSEGSVRAAEGLSGSTAVLHGELPTEICVRENGLHVMVGPTKGHKTGYYCDQRLNRRLLRSLSVGRRVLDTFAYTGGFSIHAGAGEALRVVAVDSSSNVLTIARQNWALNHLPASKAVFVHADVQRYLRDTDEVFDLLVLDPPALARQRKDVARGARAYKDLHLWAFRRAASGALLQTFTCSQHVSGELFRKIVLGAAVDARREVQLVESLGPGPDHPVALGHSEGEYLRGFLLRVD